MKKSTIITRFILIVGIIVVSNLITNELFFRIDFTADKRYTLSSSTEDIIDNLDDVVTITAYFTDNLPPQLVKAKRDFEDLLVEYENRSGNNIVYRFISPNEDEQSERKAQEEGIRPLMVNVTQKDQAQQMRVYMGAILQLGEKSEVIPVIPPGAGVEYTLTTAIKKLSIDEKPKIGLLQGHGEPASNALAQVMEELNVLYDVEEFTITDTTEIPTYYRSIAIIAPTDSFPPTQRDQLDRYMQNGGNIFLAYSNLLSNLEQQYLSPKPEIGVGEWLSTKGISLENKYLIDASCSSVSVQQNMGGFVMNTQKQFPFFPIISNFADHPATEGLEAVVLPFVSAIKFDPSDSLNKITPLAFTSEQTGLVNTPTMVDINREWTQEDFGQSPQPVAVSVELENGSRLVVISNSSFTVNGSGQQQQRLNEDNVNFTSNIIDWLSDDTGLINLRTKGITSRPIAQVDDATRNLYKYGNVIAPILLILGFAFYRKQKNNKKRQNWIDGNF